MKQVKMLNTMARTYNGTKGGKSVYVDEVNVAHYEANGFERASQVIEKQEEEAQNALVDKVEQERIDAENAEAQRIQNEKQKELDDEHAGNDPKNASVAPVGEVGGEDISDKADVSDVDALTADLGSVPAPKKGIQAKKAE